MLRVPRIRFALSLTAVVVACATQSDGGRDATMRSRVHDVLVREYVHGIPFDVARSLGREAVPVLLDVLAQPESERERESAILLLGMIGDARAREPLIAFFQNTAGEVGLDRFRALIKVPTALGSSARTAMRLRSID